MLAGVRVVTAALFVGVLAGCNPGVTAGGDAKPSLPVQDKGAGQGAPGAPALPGLSTAAVARTQLAGLKVAGQQAMTGYSRAKFTHWTGQGDACDTREVVLERSGKDVKRDSECKAVSGTWVSVYDGVTVTDAAKLDIDHMVPLANAWRSGAGAWTAERRKEFANDLTRPQLLAVSAATNRSKGDQGPDEWQPPARAYWCTYATAWTNVKATYQLTVTEAEKAKLTEMLETCS
ncbi:HNH endonuclease family protein [Streptomyces sp. DSM 116496]|uniref:HNH endonuclease family protein n=1 Tax=Streptomyces stoeckheimensis TaxID=3344656 RepID=UPI0038B37959